MRLFLIGDIIGKPGRNMVRRHLKTVREEHGVDLVVANGENAAHGFGLTLKTVNELRTAGVDLFTGGNHTWDKKEIVGLFDSHPVIRPLNYPEGVPGSGTFVTEIGGAKLAVVNLMGYYTMPMVENPFNTITKEIARLEGEGIRHIVIDFHAEATSEKNALLSILKGRVGFIAGTHTHVGTDDLAIWAGTGYVSDIGLTGCRDGIIGMEPHNPISTFTTGVKSSFKVPNSCRAILQGIVMELDAEGRCTEAYKLRALDETAPEKTLTAVMEA